VSKLDLLVENGCNSIYSNLFYTRLAVSSSGGTHPEFPEALLIYRRSSCRPVFPDQDEPDLLFNLIRTDLISCLTFSGK